MFAIVKVTITVIIVTSLTLSTVADSNEDPNYSKPPGIRLELFGEETYSIISTPTENIVQGVAEFIQFKEGQEFNLQITHDLVRPSFRSSYKFTQYMITTPYKHLNEMCPNEHKNCWCEFFSSTAQSVYTPEVKNFVKVCIDDDYWRENKHKIYAKITSEHVDYNKYVIGRKIDARLRPALRTFIDDWMAPFEYDTHDDAMCPTRFSWCWCGVVKRYIDYVDRKNGSYPNPVLVVDCRPMEERPFEKRDCSPTKAQDNPWYRRMFSLGPEIYPCGRFS